MSVETLIKEFESTLEFVPLPEIPNASRICLRAGAQLPHPAPELNEEEWDKFEKDIEETFEKVP